MDYWPFMDSHDPAARNLSSSAPEQITVAVLCSTNISKLRDHKGDNDDNYACIPVEVAINKV